jgi:NAD(P)-dependent dehydrogenase (short-subunit alcohol dehydrogenase family)
MSRTIVVTGAGDGIGRAMAMAFAAAGDHVVAVGLPPFRELPESVRVVPLDIRDESGVARLLASLDRIDVLVHAAGIIRRRDEFDPAVFDEVLEVNLGAAMKLCMSAKPLLERGRAEGGDASVLFVASMLSFFGSGQAPAYAASKGAVVQLAKSLAIAWGPAGIRVNCVAPGWIETALTQPLRDDPDRARKIVERTPLGRWGRPEDVSGAAVFLASDRARFITGVVLPVDGGYLVA